MAGVQDVDLALAVTGSGALGSLPCALFSTEQIREQLERIRARPGAIVNLNFFCHAPPVASASREAAWRTALAPYYLELGVNASFGPAGAARAPFSAELAGLLAEFRPAVVSFHFGLPAPDLLARVRSLGARILSSATTLEEALWLERQGVDAIIAQGLEAGGHRGIFLSDDLSTQLGTMALVPQVVRKTQLPVIAAGGIADARGVAAAMALGAAGVQIGTAYLLCPEASTSALHRAALKSDRAGHTALTNLFTGRPARGIVNRVMRELGPINAHVPAFPLAAGAIAPLRASAESRGSGDFSALWSGQNSSGCREIPAADLTRELAAGL